MPWVRFDDQFPIHRKVDRLSDAAFRLHVAAIFWCARNLTDGFVSHEEVARVGGSRRPHKQVAELVDRGCWDVVADGWQIHDYLDYQPSAEQVERDRKASAERQKRWRESHKNKPHNAVTNGVSNRNGVSNGVSHGGSNRSPSRPPLKGEGDGAGAGRGAPPPSPDNPASSHLPAVPDRCALHMQTLPCISCAADAKAAPDPWDDEPAPVGRIDARALLRAARTPHEEPE